MTRSTLKNWTKSLFAAAIAAAPMLAATTDARAEGAPEKVTIGYLNLVNAQLVTKSLGLVAKEMPGVEIEYIKVGGGGDMLRAIAADQIDFGGLGNPPTAIGVTRGLPIQGTMVLNMLDYVEAMAVRTSAGIKSFKDLKGKKVAAPFGSTTHYLLLQALADEGINPADMEILDLRPNDIAVAWSRGDIDAAWFWEPNLDKAVKDGGNIFMTSGIMEKRGYPTWDVGVVMNRFAEAYPDYVTKFIKAECAGIDYWINNPKETAKIIAEELELSLPDATRMMRGTEMVPCDVQLSDRYIGTSEKRGGFVDTLLATSEFLVSQDRLPASLTREEFETFLHPEYLEAAVAGE